MGNMNIRVKLMPSSPDTDLEKIKKDAKKVIESLGGSGVSFTEEPIAFGLKAVIATCTWPESKELEEVEESLGNIDNVSSEELIDMRRAVG